MTGCWYVRNVDTILNPVVVNVVALFRPNVVVKMNIVNYGNQKSKM